MPAENVVVVAGGVQVLRNRGEHVDPTRCRTGGQGDQELSAAPAADEIAGAHGAPEVGGERLERVVSGLMPELVVQRGRGGPTASGSPAPGCPRQRHPRGDPG